MKHISSLEHVEFMLRCEDSPFLICKQCHHPVPNNMLELAKAGGLGPCPVCGGEEVVDNPANLSEYVKVADTSLCLSSIVYVPDFVRMVPCSGLVPDKKEKHPMIIRIPIG